MAFATLSSLFATPSVTPAQKHMESLQAGKQLQQVTRLENTAHVLSF